MYIVDHVCLAPMKTVHWEELRGYFQQSKRKQRCRPPWYWPMNVENSAPAFVGYIYISSLHRRCFLPIKQHLTRNYKAGSRSGKVQKGAKMMWNLWFLVFVSRTSLIHLTYKCLRLFPGGSECSWDKERLTSPPAGAHSGGPGGGGGGGGGGGAVVSGAGGGGGAAGGAGRGPALGAVNQQQLQQQQQLLANSEYTHYMGKGQHTHTHTSQVCVCLRGGNIC